jgi:hypothetical protein
MEVEQRLHPVAEMKINVWDLPTMRSNVLTTQTAPRSPLSILSINSSNGHLKTSELANLIPARNAKHHHVEPRTGS